MKHKIVSWLNRSNSFQFSLYAFFFSFSTYFCMYAFRKPLSVGSFEGSVNLFLLPQMNLKIYFLFSQLAGYTLSKYIGIKYVSETNQDNRGKKLFSLILWAHLCLLLFALLYESIGVLFLFFNGLCLGMIWGLVFSYLEGRKLSDFLGPGLSASFIIGSGAVKSVGKIFIHMGVPEHWMPFMTGLLFLPLIAFCIFMLNLIPKPTKEEEMSQTKRKPMNKEERKKFFIQFAPGFIVMSMVYLVTTAYRDFRDNFSRELWDSFGFEESASIYALAEMPIAFSVLVILGLLVFVRSNRTTFYLLYAIMGAGALTVGLSTLAYEGQLISPTLWMILVGFGLYLTYVPFGCMLYDNLISFTGVAGTAAFMIYVSDFVGYVGSFGILLYKNFITPNIAWDSFFLSFSYFTSVVCTVGIGWSFYYFYNHEKIRKKEDGQKEFRGTWVPSPQTIIPKSLS